MDIALDDNHDIFVTASDLTMTTEDNSVVQALGIRLQFILSEWFLDNTAGVPYPTIIFEKGTNISTIYSIFRREIIETQGVQKLISLNLVPENANKKLKIDFEVKQDSGQILSQQIVLGI